MILRCLHQLEYDVVRLAASDNLERRYPDISSDTMSIIRKVSPFTMTSVEKQIALIDSVRYIAASKIEGCFVECGVWREAQWQWP